MRMLGLLFIPDDPSQPVWLQIGWAQRVLRQKFAQTTGCVLQADNVFYFSLALRNHSVTKDEP